MIDQEKSIEGWLAIAELFQVSTRTMIKRKEELQKSGAIYYRIKGKPPRKVVCAFPSKLKQWIADKSKKNELF